MFLAESGAFGPWPAQGVYAQSLEGLLKVAYREFCEWKKEKAISCNQPRFTAARCNRRARTSWACLSSKAVAGKCVTFFLQEVCGRWAQRRDAAALEMRIATCIWTYAELLRIMDQSGPIFEESTAKEFYDKGLMHLQLYSALRHQSSRTFGANSGMRYLFQLLPKHHYFFHMVMNVRRELVNPRFYTLLCAESWIGLIGRIGRTCHRLSLSKRVLERYLVKVGLHISKLE